MHFARILAAGVLSTGLAASGALAAHATPTTSGTAATAVTGQSVATAQEVKAPARKKRTIAARTVSKAGGQRFFVLATVKTPERGYRNGQTALERKVCERRGDNIVPNSCNRFKRVGLQRTNSQSRVRYRVTGPSDYRTAYVFRVKTPRNAFFKVSYSRDLPVGKK